MSLNRGSTHSHPLLGPRKLNGQQRQKADEELFCCFEFHQPSSLALCQLIVEILKSQYVTVVSSNINKKEGEGLLPDSNKIHMPGSFYSLIHKSQVFKVQLQYLPHYLKWSLN